MTDDERAALDELPEPERDALVIEAQRVAKADERGRMWGEGPPVEPKPARIAVPYATGSHNGEFLVEAARTREEIIEDCWERDPATGEWRRW